MKMNLFVVDMPAKADVSQRGMGRRLERERQRHGYTSKTLAKALGIEHKTLTNFEHGKGDLHLGVLAQLQTLGLDVAYIANDLFIYAVPTHVAVKGHLEQAYAQQVRTNPTARMDPTPHTN